MMQKKKQNKDAELALEWCHGISSLAQIRLDEGQCCCN